MKLLLGILVFSSSTVAQADVGKCLAMGRVGGEDKICAKYDNTDQIACKKADGNAWCAWKPATVSVNSAGQEILNVFLERPEIATDFGKSANSVRFASVSSIDSKTTQYVIDAEKVQGDVVRPGATLTITKTLRSSGRGGQVFDYQYQIKEKP